MNGFAPRLRHSARGRQAAPPRPFRRAIWLLLLAACGPIYAGPTGYDRLGSFSSENFGYSDRKIGEDEFSVFVKTNPTTTRERATDIALLRAAEITRQNGRTHFTVITQSTETLPAKETISAPLGGLLVWVPVGERDTGYATAVLLIRLVASGQIAPADSLEAARVIQEAGARFGTSVSP